MIRVKNENYQLSSKKQRRVLKIKNYEDLHGILDLLAFRKDYLIDKFSEFFNIPADEELVIYFILNDIAENIDIEWERKIKFLWRNMLEIEKIMWNLSTLGGAYSAMGDFDIKFAETASKISQHQIKLAKKLNDPSVLARCYLYTALAEAQMNRFSNAIKLVKAVHYWSVHVNYNPLVTRCSQGIYKKIVAIHKFGNASKKKSSG